MRTHLLAAAAAVAFMTPFAANAALVTIDPLAATWQNLVGGSSITNNGTQSNPNSASVRWGTPVPSTGGKSGYDFAPVATPLSYTVPPNTAPFLLGDFIHQNFPIASGTSITAAQLKLTAGITIDGVSQGDFDFVFDFSHTETPNNANPCAAGGANNQGVNINGCADIVVVTNFAMSETFLVDGQTVTLNVLGFSNDGGAAINNTFLTAENQSNSTGLYANIAAVAVPEPASLALLGAGLLGLGLARRRRA